MPKPLGTFSVLFFSVTVSLVLLPLVSMPLRAVVVISTPSNTRLELSYLMVPPMAEGIRPTSWLLTTLPFFTVSVASGLLISKAALFASVPVQVQVWPSRSTVRSMVPELNAEPGV